jgi:hypothetical protein
MKKITTLQNGPSTIKACLKITRKHSPLIDAFINLFIVIMNLFNASTLHSHIES